MAGSYRHATDEHGQLRNPQTMTNATETPGDAYETVAELYGMVWYLADGDGTAVEDARQRWRDGIGLSPGIQPEG